VTSRGRRAAALQVLKEHIGRQVSEALSRSVESLYRVVDRLYELSGYKINKDLYRKLLPHLVYGTVFLTLTCIIVSTIYLVTNLSLLRYISITTSVLLMALFLMLGGLYAYALAIIHKRAVHFNERIIYTLSYIVPLLATSNTLVDIIVKVYELEQDPEIKHELELILKECALGEDIITAIKRSIERVPSLIYKDIMSSLIESVRLTLEPEKILVQKLEALLRNKFIKLRQIITSLTLTFQSYVVLSFLAPALLFVIFGALEAPGKLIGAIASMPGVPLTASALTLPVNIFGLALLLALVYSPIIAAIFYVIFDTMMSVI